MINIRKELEKNSNKIILGSIIAGITGLILISYLHSSHSKKKPLETLLHFIENIHDSLQESDIKEHRSEIKRCEHEHKCNTRTSDLLELISLGLNLLNKITKR